MAQAFDEEEEKPLDPAVEKVRRKLVRFVAINLGLLFLALMAVAAAIVYKSRSGDAPAAEAALPSGEPGTVLEGEIALPAGAKVLSQSLSGTNLSLDVELAGGSRMIVLYDLAGRRTIGRYAIRPQ